MKYMLARRLCRQQLRSACLSSHREYGAEVSGVDGRRQDGRDGERQARRRGRLNPGGEKGPDGLVPGGIGGDWLLVARLETVIDVRLKGGG